MEEVSLLSPREPYGRARCAGSTTPKIYSIQFEFLSFNLK